MQLALNDVGSTARTDPRLDLYRCLKTTAIRLNPVTAGDCKFPFGVLVHCLTHVGGVDSILTASTVFGVLFTASDMD